jgi:hypothetical protein
MRRMLLLPFFLAASAGPVAACSGDGVDAAPGTSSGGTDASSSAAEAVPGASSDGSSAFDAAMSPEASDDDAGPKKDDRLHPNETARAWTYERFSSYGGKAGTVTVVRTVTGKEMVEGHDAWVLVETTSPGGATSTFYEDVQGDNVLWMKPTSNVEHWIPVAKAPVLEGASFTQPYGSGTVANLTWLRAPKQTVRAGTFDDCWRLDFFVVGASNPNDPNYSVLCRGVGTVLTVTKQSNTFELHEELLAKSF